MHWGLGMKPVGCIFQALPLPPWGMGLDVLLHEVVSLPPWGMGLDVVLHEVVYVSYIDCRYSCPI